MTEFVSMHELFKHVILSADGFGIVMPAGTLNQSWFSPGRLLTVLILNS